MRIKKIKIQVVSYLKADDQNLSIRKIEICVGLKVDNIQSVLLIFVILLKK